MIVYGRIVHCNNCNEDYDVYSDIGETGVKGKVYKACPTCAAPHAWNIFADENYFEYNKGD